MIARQSTHLFPLLCNLSHILRTLYFLSCQYPCKLTFDPLPFHTLFPICLHVFTESFWLNVLVVTWNVELVPHRHSPYMMLVFFKWLPYLWIWRTVVKYWQWFYRESNSGSPPICLKPWGGQERSPTLGGKLPTRFKWFLSPMFAFLRCMHELGRVLSMCYFSWLLSFLSSEFGWRGLRDYDHVVLREVCGTINIVGIAWSTKGVET